MKAHMCSLRNEMKSQASGRWRESSAGYFEKVLRSPEERRRTQPLCSRPLFLREPPVRNAKFDGHSNEFCNRPGLHLPHYLAPMDLKCDL